jgi:hypothetical protein
MCLPLLFRGVSLPDNQADTQPGKKLYNQERSSSSLSALI